MRIFRSVLTLTTILGLAVPAFANSDLGTSRPGATMMKKAHKKKVEEEKKTEDADGTKHEEKTEKTEEVKPEK